MKSLRRREKSPPKNRTGNCSTYRKARSKSLSGLSPLARKFYRTYDKYFYFYFIPTWRVMLTNDSCLPIYKTIPAICNTPCQTHCTEFHFSALRHGDYVLWAKLWFVVVCCCVNPFTPPARKKNQRNYEKMVLPKLPPLLRYLAENSFIVVVGP